MRSFSWVIARGIMLIIFVPISLSWADFFRDYITFTVEACPVEKCRDIPVIKRLFYLVIMTLIGFLIMYALYKCTNIMEF